jgi:hypothetical protein
MGVTRVEHGKAKKDEMKVKDPPTSPPHHAYGEGGPEKQSGSEGPDHLPGRKGKD